MICHLSQKIELMAEFRVFIPVWFIPAGRNVKIMDGQPADRRADMTGISPAGPVHMADITQRQPREDRHPIIGFLSAHSDMRPPCLSDCHMREMFILCFGFLQAQDIWLMFLQPVCYKVYAQAN